MCQRRDKVRPITPWLKRLAEAKRRKVCQRQTAKKSWLILGSGEQRNGNVGLKCRIGVYRGRKKALGSDQVERLQQRVQSGEPKAGPAREFGISRETLYQYLRANDHNRSQTL